MNRGILPLSCVAAMALMAGCSSGADRQSQSSPSSIPAEELAHIRSCVDALAQTSGQPTTVTAYPANAATLTQDLTLPIKAAGSGDIYLVWMEGTFTDPYGSVTINGATQAAPTVMWMAIPAGSPEAVCPTDDVGFNGGPKEVDPTVLGPGISVP